VYDARESVGWQERTSRGRGIATCTVDTSRQVQCPNCDKTLGERRGITLVELQTPLFAPASTIRISLI
jgi:hypothetical protein